jgi:hypothetical protein
VVVLVQQDQQASVGHHGSLQRMRIDSSMARRPPI